MSEDLPDTGTLRTRPAASYNRRRANNACLICRLRKTKCDNQRPRCGFCLSTGGDCRYVDSDPSQLDRSTLTILQRISQLETSLISRIDSKLKDNTASPANHQFLGEPRDLHDYASQTQEQSAPPGPHDWPTIGSIDWRSPALSGTVQDNLVTPVVSSDDAPPSAEVLLRASDEMSIESILKWPIFSEVAPHLVPTFHVSLIEVIGQPKPNLAGQSRSTLPDLSPDTINHLVRNFLNNNHIKNPVLDVRALWTDAREFAESGPQWDGRSCLLLLVCAISTLSASLSDELSPGVSKQKDKLVTAEAYFTASQRRLGMLCHENSFIGAQCSFLSAVYLMSTLRILAAWKCFVQAGSQCLVWLTSQGRMTQGSKLNAADSSDDNMPWQQNESERAHHIEESLYWSCLKSEIEVRFHLKLPGSGLGEIAYPHLYPSPPKDVPDVYDQASPSSAGSWSFSGAAQTHIDRQNIQLAWYFYLAEIALKRKMHNLLVWRYNIRSRGEETDQESKDRMLQRNVVEFERQKEEWYQTLPAQMKFPQQSDAPANGILRLILRGHMNDVRDLVRFPALEEIIALDAHAPLRSFSPTQLRITQECLEVAAESIEANRESFYHRHQGTWLMARTCTKSALILLAMALRCRAEARSTGVQAAELEEMMLPSRWRKVVEQTIEVLEYWSEESNDLARSKDLLQELFYIYES